MRVWVIGFGSRWLGSRNRETERQREGERSKYGKTTFSKNSSFIKGAFLALTKGITMKPGPCIALDPTKTLNKPYINPIYNPNITLI